MNDFANAKNPSVEAHDSQADVDEETIEVGAELVVALQRSLNTWWSNVTKDDKAMAALAERLGPLRQATDGGQATADDLAGVVEALVLLEKRVDELEGRMRAMAEVVGDVARRVSRLKTGDSP